MTRYTKRALLGAGLGALAILLPMVAFGSVNAAILLPRFVVFGLVGALIWTIAQDAWAVLCTQLVKHD